jgi:glycosyltransferase involved in cell wall biosynthesis
MYYFYNFADICVFPSIYESFGITIAEAMSYGKPVIATGYSGNLDFMTDKNSMLVSWKQIKVGKDAEGYSPESYWAEPDLDEAALAMRRLFEDRAFAKNLGIIAKEDLLARFSAERTGERMKKRLQEIWDQPHGR